MKMLSYSQQVRPGMLSYAQNGEDILLSRVFRADQPGFYIDVGANDPVTHSVTKHFYEHGWSGINIEPQPRLYRRLIEDRPRDRNLNVGVSDHEGAITFYEAPDADGWSTFSPEQAEQLRQRGLRVREQPVSVMTLAAICEQHVADRPIDFLKIDAESLETQVIRGGDWTRWRPRVVLVETNGWETWEPILLTAEYRFAVFDGVNRFYVRSEDEHLLPQLTAPVNIGDDAIPFELFRYVEDLRNRSQELESLSRPSRALVRRWCRLEQRLGRVIGRVARTARKAG